MYCIAEMKAKLEPRNDGIEPFVKAWNINVPIPAPSKAIDGDIPLPTNKGTKQVDPIIATQC